jgi:hypothetical protein
VTVGIERNDACGFVTESVEYTGSLPVLPALLVGFDGGACAESAGAGSIRRLRLRLLDDPSACPDGKSICGEGGAEPTCVDLGATPEHCGACDHACATSQVCESGICVCAPSNGILACGGSCIDSRRSIEHCGVCDHACERNCAGGVCDVDTGECDAPPEIPPEGGSVPVDFAMSPDERRVLCAAEGLLARRVTVFEWTPVVTGTASISVHITAGNALVEHAVTLDATCEAWSFCGQSVLLGDGLIELPVAAGQTYLVGIGVVFPQTDAEADAIAAALTVEVN